MAINTGTLRAGPPPLAVSAARTGRRARLDRLASRLVVGGGLVIIASILAILVVIGGEAIPLFRPATMRLVATQPLRAPTSAPVRPLPGALGVDEYRELAWVVSERALSLLALRGHAAARQTPIGGLDGAIATAVTGVTGSRSLIGTSDGRVIPLEIRIGVDYPEGRRTVTAEPVFGPARAIDPGAGRPVRRLAAAHPERGSIVVAQLAAAELVLGAVVERKALIGGTRREESRQRLAVPLDGEVTALAIDGRGDDLFVGTSGGEVLRYDLRDRAAPTVAERVTAAAPGVAITTLGFLIGDRTLVVGDARGGVSSWQVVPGPGGGLPRLTRVNRFDPHADRVVAFSPSRRDKGFVTADAGGGVHVAYGTSGQTLVRTRAEPPGVPAAAVLAPKADGVLTVAADGAVRHWALHNPHPETTLRTLFGPVWYEGYTEPDHVWQSTGGTDDFEAKLGLTPLVYGTLKGTFYALLFAVPLALLAALYVSEFMHPSLKASLKPIVEIMAALPSVVLGFLAGLWLAPLVERVVPGLLVLPVVMTGAILAAYALWQALPARARGGVRPGGEVFLLVPVVVLSAVAAFALGGVIERWLLGGDYRGWLLSALGLTYDQRNSLVVGIAMGFAVVPIIFTIAEDSLANVPRHLRAGALALGATRWQTALRVVLPTASPGIFSAIMIGFGRAVGETMIVLMATGNTPVMNWSIFSGFRALSANIAVELPEAPEGGTLFRVLFLAAFLLFCLTFAVNTLAEVVRLGLRRRYRSL